MVTCKHKFKKLYYRAYNSDNRYQSWIKLENKMICEKCKKLVEIK